MRQTSAQQTISIDPRSPHRRTAVGSIGAPTSIKLRNCDIPLYLLVMPAPEWVLEQLPGSATIIAVRSYGIREGREQDETRYDVTSLHTGAKVLLRAIRQRWSIENSWHWVWDVPLQEDAHPCRENNRSQILATLAAWLSMPCDSVGSGRSSKGLPPWVTPSRGCSDCWAGNNQPRSNIRDGF